MKILIKIKTRDKKLFTKNFHGEQFSWEKITPGKLRPRKINLRKIAPHSPRKKKKENWLQKKLPLRWNVKEREQMIRKLIKTKSLHTPRKNTWKKSQKKPSGNKSANEKCILCYCSYFTAVFRISKGIRNLVQETLI